MCVTGSAQQWKMVQIQDGCRTPRRVSGQGYACSLGIKVLDGLEGMKVLLSGDQKRETVNHLN